MAPPPWCSSEGESYVAGSSYGAGLATLCCFQPIVRQCRLLSEGIWSSFNETNIYKISRLSEKIEIVV